MSIVIPFRGLRPRPELAERVASPPYDVLSSEEARQMAEGNPISFLHVNKPEIDLDPLIDIHDDIVYETGRRNLQKFIDEEVLIRDSSPCLYLYQQRMMIGEREHVQVGLMAGVSVDEYQNDLIKKHELTRTDKEADRTRHVDRTNANAGPVFLTYESVPAIDAIVASLCLEKPTYDFMAKDRIVHRLWRIHDKGNIDALVEAFAKVPHLYVADGHHRSASASAVREIRKKANPNHTGNESYNYFLAVVFPHDQMYIMDYNRVVADLNGHTESELLKLVADNFEVEDAEQPSPSKATEFGMYLGKKWYRLKAKPCSFDSNHPVECLDVAILQKNLLAPLLGIEDPRTDTRIDFIGGIRGSAELERRADATGGVAFAMFPTAITQLMAIADAGKVMPPKSTWFEPKLRSGMVVRLLD